MSNSKASEATPMPGPMGGHGHGHMRHPWHHRFSEEEWRVIKQCKRESLLYRAMPLAATFGALTYAAVKYGFLAANARFGAIPKVLLAVIVGYSIGKISYRNVCREKLMALPNSQFGQYLRERRSKCKGPWGFPSRESLMAFEAGGHPRDFYWGQGPLPTEKPTASEKNEA